MAQEAWILNQTLKENILFNNPIDEARYEEVIRCCALVPDLNLLEGGDKTEIGEKGINLSGGQKQRVSIARAVYSDADLYLFDDSLSAVDAHVAKHLFERVLSSSTGFLKNKTRILVTNKLEVLPDVDRIYCLRNGKIVETGTYQQLLEAKQDFTELIEKFSFSNKNQSEVATKDNEEKEKADVVKSQKDTATKKLIDDEYMETGRVKFEVYKTFLKLLPTLGVCVALLSYVAAETSTVLSNLWLAAWSNDKNSDLHHAESRLMVYGILGALRG